MLQYSEIEKANHYVTVSTMSVPETRNETPIHELKDNAFRLDSGIRGLIEGATHLSVPFGQRWL
jgi:hypothetical protein